MIKEKRKLLSILLIIFLFSSVALSAEELSGIVFGVGDKPLGDVTIILMETDDITVTDNNGSFTFSGLNEGEYHLQVFSMDYPELIVPVTLPLAEEPLIIRLVPTEIEMEAIEIVDSVEDDPIVSSGETVMNHEELQGYSANSDPLDAIKYESGVIEQGLMVQRLIQNPQALLMDFVDGLTSDPGRPKMHIYGGDSDWNTFYYRHIRIPSNTHMYGIAQAPPVLPIEATGKMVVHKGAIPVDLGPGVGGLFQLHPLKEYESDFGIQVTPSFDSFPLILHWQPRNDMGLLVSFRQSLSQWTTLPIMVGVLDLVEKANGNQEGSFIQLPESFAYGDLLTNYWFQTGNHLLQADLFAVYDSILMEYTEKVYEWEVNPDYDPYTDVDGNSIVGERVVGVLKKIPYFVGGGVSWDYAPTLTLANSAYLNVTWYHNAFELAMFEDDPNSNVPEDVVKSSNLESDQKVLSATIGDEVLFALDEQNHFEVGGMVRYSYMDGMKENTMFQISLGDVGLGDPDREDAINGGAEETEEDTVAFTDKEEAQEHFVKTHLYARYIHESDNLRIKTGAAFVYYPVENKIYPVLEQEVGVRFGIFSSSLRAGWAPAEMDEFVALNRRLGDFSIGMVGMGDSNATQEDMSTPPQGVTMQWANKVAIDDSNSISLIPYAAYYYGIQGDQSFGRAIDDMLSGSGSLDDLTDSEQRKMLGEVKEGYSVGGDLAYNLRIEDLLHLKASYGYNFTQYYHPERKQWFFPSFAVGHALRLSATWTPDERNTIGIHFRMYSGAPYTSKTVVTADDAVFGDPSYVPTAIDGYYYKMGDPLTETDYVPQLDLVLTYKGTITMFGKDVKWFINSGNLLWALSPMNMNLKVYLDDNPGASTLNLEDRYYYYEPKLFWGSLLTFNFGFSVKF